MRYSEYNYERTDPSKVKIQMAEIMDGFTKAKNVSEQKLWMDKSKQVFSDYETNSAIARLNFNRNTKDHASVKENDYFDEIDPNMREISLNWAKTLLAGKFRNELEESFGNQFFDQKELELKSFDPKIKGLVEKENKMENEYTKLIAGAEIEFEGKTYNLAGLSPFHLDKDRNVRKKSYTAMFGFFEKNADELDTIYDKLVEIRHKMALELGYDNFIKLGYARMQRTDYDHNDVAAYRQQIVDHVVPLVTKLHEQKKEILGLDTLYIYDGINFKDGDPKPKGTPEDLVEAAKNMYDELSPETGAFFKMMIDEELLDLVNRDGKMAGGFCTSFPKYQRPYIFSNFNGTDHDVTVLTHEAGHAFQTYSARHQPLIEYYWPTYEAAEIHSMSMEFITWPWMEDFFKEDTERFKYLHMVKSISFLPYGACVDHFQHWVYGNPEASPADRKAKWSELEKNYLPERDYDDLEFPKSGGIWQRQLHIYQVPFYYIDYTLAQVCAFQFWTKFNADRKTAWDDYHRLCKAGGSLPFTKLTDVAKIESPFKAGVLEKVVGEIWDWLKSVDVKSL